MIRIIGGFGCLDFILHQRKPLANRDMKKVDYFKSQKHISFGSKTSCDTCKRYPTEIWIVQNPNFSFIGWVFKGEKINNWYCVNCLPPLTPNK